MHFKTNHPMTSVKASANPFLNCQFTETVSTSKPALNMAVAEVGQEMRSKNLAACQLKMPGNTRYLVDLNQMKTINPDVFGEDSVGRPKVTDMHPAVHYSKDGIVVLKNEAVSEIKKAMQNAVSA